MKVSFSFFLILAFLGLQACGGVRESPNHSSNTVLTTNGQSCLGDSDCAGGECIMPGICHSNRGSENMTFADIDPASWFVYGDGSCNYEADCGPHVCQSGWCVPLERTNRPIPLRREFEYYDSSCSTNAHCPIGLGWTCQEGWCQSPQNQNQNRSGGNSQTCLGDGDCGGGECIMPGICQSNRGSEYMTFADIEPTSWLVYADGSCNYDGDCGPHVCQSGWCRPLEQTNRSVPTRSEFEYYDSSCTDNAHCPIGRGWSCQEGWCRGSVQNQNQNGQTCLGDTDCGGGGECIMPGICQSNRGSEYMTFADIDPTSWLAYSDGSCSHDTDCGPHVCQFGWCISLEQTNRPRPTRSEFEYYDSSCSDNAHCPTGRGWVCHEGWCGDQLYLYQYSRDPSGLGEAFLQKLD